jgi:hypothetical protein
MQEDKDFLVRIWCFALVRAYWPTVIFSGTLMV